MESKDFETGPSKYVKGETNGQSFSETYNLFKAHISKKVTAFL